MSSNNNNNNSVNIPVGSLNEGEHAVEFYATDTLSTRGSIRLMRFTRISLDAVAIEFGNPTVVRDGTTFVSSVTPITVSTPYNSLKVQYQVVPSGSNPADTAWVTSTSSSVTFNMPSSLQDGSYTIFYRATSGNKFGSIKSITIVLDNTPPSTSINIQDGAFLTDSDTITITATDDGSGVAKIFYRIDGGEWLSS
ncbi:MAG: Ig-like domain-containing protein [Candidatus Nitrosocaldus sp.]